MSSCEFIEYTIKVKDERNCLSEKEICYEPLLLAKEDENLRERVEALVEKFMDHYPSQESPEVTIRAKMVWQS